MEAEVPLVDVQARVATWPALTVAGVAVTLTDGGGGLLTATATVELTVPPGPVAVAVYAVALVGDTTTEPFAVSRPMLLSIVTLVALDDVQLRVVLPPWLMLAGTALKLIVGGNTIVTVALAVVVPPAPVTVAV